MPCPRAHSLSGQSQGHLKQSVGQPHATHLQGSGCPGNPRQDVVRTEMGATALGDTSQSPPESLRALGGGRGTGGPSSHLGSGPAAPTSSPATISP